MVLLPKGQGCHPAETAKGTEPYWFGEPITEGRWPCPVRSVPSPADRPHWPGRSDGRHEDVRVGRSETGEVIEITGEGDAATGLDDGGDDVGVNDVG